MARGMGSCGGVRQFDGSGKGLGKLVSPGKPGKGPRITVCVGRH